MDMIINNFTGGEKLILGASAHEKCGPLVRIIQDEGSMRFHFSMTPEQARQLGAALYELADSLDAEPLTQEAA